MVRPLRAHCYQQKRLRALPFIHAQNSKKTLERIKIEVRWTPAGDFYSAESDGQADAMIPVVLTGLQEQCISLWLIPWSDDWAIDFEDYVFFSS